MNNYIKTKKVKFVKPETLIIAVDIGKNTITGYLQSTEGEEVKPFEFSNDLNGLNEFWNKVMKFKKKYGINEIIAGFESTGTYGEPFKNFMRDKEVKLVQVNPFHTKRLKEVIDNSPGKTDKKDPRVIASLIRLGHTLSLITPKGEFAELRELIWARERRIKERTAHINIIESLMFKIFPEFSKIFKDFLAKTAIYLIERYTAPDKLKDIELNELSQILKRVSRGKFGEHQAKCLLCAANNSLGTREGFESILMEIKYIMRQIKTANEFISELEKEIEYKVAKIPYSQRLLSIKGIGLITVAGIIGEVGDFKSFNTQHEIMKLAGLDLYEISSGRHKGKKRISKRGRPLLRKILYFAALNTIRKGGIFHSYYKRLVEKGKEKMKAIIAVARKLFKVIFAIVRDDTNYIENYKPSYIHLEKVA